MSNNNRKNYITINDRLNRRPSCLHWLPFFHKRSNMVIGLLVSESAMYSRDGAKEAAVAIHSNDCNIKLFYFK